jgi:hypothetical protein
MYAMVNAPAQDDEVVVTTNIVARQGTRMSWKLRGGKVLVAGREEEARFVVLALDPEGRDTQPLGAEVVYSPDRAPEEKPVRLGAKTLAGVETVVLVDAPVWDGGEAGNLARFVDGGGALVMLAKPAEVSPQGTLLWAHKPNPLPVARMAHEVETGHLSMSFEGSGLESRDWMPQRVVKLEGWEPGARSEVSLLQGGRDVKGIPVLMTRRYGKGRSILLATAPKWGGIHTQSDFPALMNELVDYVPVAEEVTIRTDVSVEDPPVVDEEKKRDIFDSAAGKR